MSFIWSGLLVLLLGVPLLLLIYFRMQQREIELKQSFKRAGVDMLSLSTQDDMVRTIVRFAQQRKQLRKIR